MGKENLVLIEMSGFAILSSCKIGRFKHLMRYSSVSKWSFKIPHFPNSYLVDRVFRKNVIKMHFCAPVREGANCALSFPFT